MGVPYESETGCCPRFDPEPWHEKQVVLEERLFVKDRIRALFHIPLNFGAVMTRNFEKIMQAQAISPQPLVLSDENSLWGSDVYIAVSREVPQAKNVRLSGNFLARVFEGPYRDVRKWVEEMKRYVQSEGQEVKQMYFYYTTCPKCAKHYGKNYVVLLARVDSRTAPAV